MLLKDTVYINIKIFTKSLLFFTAFYISPHKPHELLQDLHEETHLEYCCVDPHQADHFLPIKSS